MSVSQVTQCDCCGTELADASVLNCSILTLMDEGGVVTQRHYGIKCGCSGAVVALAAEDAHAGHIPPPLPGQPDPNAPTPLPPGAPEATPLPLGTPVTTTPPREVDVTPAPETPPNP